MNAVLQRSIVWDNHTCMPLRPQDERFLPQLERFRKTGVTVVAINVGFGEQGVEPHVRMLAHFRRWILARPDEYLLIERAGDVQRAKDSGRLGIFFDIEGANAIDDQLSLVQLYYDLGVRWMLIAYNLANRAGGGCMEPDGGLTPFGEQMIDEMDRAGMVVCCSHTGERTALEVIEHSRNPVIFSHSNPRALWEHPRNVRDHVIRACAEKGGVIGINGVGIFLGANDTRSETLARNIDYVARLAGIDHVALGLDYVFDNDELLEYLKARPALFGNDATTQYADSDLERILGLNLLRVAQTVWK